MTPQPRCPHCGGHIRWNYQDVSNGAFLTQENTTYECEQGGLCPGLQAKLAAGLPLTELCPNGHTAVRVMVHVAAPGQDEDAWIPGDVVCTKGDLCDTLHEAEIARLVETYQRRPLTRLLRMLRRTTRSRRT